MGDLKKKEIFLQCIVGHYFNVKTPANHFQVILILELCSKVVLCIIERDTVYVMVYKSVQDLKLF